MILPRYKMRAEGEWIYYNDKVVLADRTGEENFIGCVGSENMVVS